MALLRRQYAYSKIDKEDPEEIKHRQAQFLIQKVLLQAETRRKPSFWRIRMCKLKVRIGRRLKKLRKTMLLGISAARIGVYKQLLCHMKTWKRLFHRGDTLVSLPPMFAWAWSFCPSFFYLVCQEYWHMVLVTLSFHEIWLYCFDIVWPWSLCLVESKKVWFTFQHWWIL